MPLDAGTMRTRPHGPDPHAEVVTRVGLERSFTGDPSALGVIGLLLVKEQMLPHL